MSILNYFKLKEKLKTIDDQLPRPDGPLNKEVGIPRLTIVSANVAVRSAIASQGSSRGPYLHLTPAQKFQIGKRASEHGTTNALRYYKATFPDLPELKETSVRRFKDAYRENLKKRVRCDNADELKELPNKKMGRPLLVGEDIDQQVKEYLKFLRKKGSVVNTVVAIAAAEGVIKSIDANLLAYDENGIRVNETGIELTKSWAKSLLHRMGMVKRRVSSKAKVDVENFDRIKEGFLLDIQNVVSMDEIPPALVINWDQTAIQYVPTSSWTMEEEGARRVEIAGKDDKRQITAVLAGTMSGEFLPPQLVYEGKTRRCIPKVSFPSGWDVTYTDNHWCNESTMKDYIHKIILPYVQKKRQELKLSCDYPALVLFDNFKGQCTTNILTTLDNNNINVLLIPANCTDCLQPLDISINKPVKEFLRGRFQEWYSKQVCNQLKGEEERSPIDLRLSILKPLGATWMIAAHEYIARKPDIVSNGFKFMKDILDVC